MTITQRTAVHDVECDVVCTGRFYDFMERRDGRWGMVLRQPIYEQDRLNPVSGGAAPALDPERLSAFPVGYRHLAYIQSMIGYDVKPDMPGIDRARGGGTVRAGSALAGGGDDERRCAMTSRAASDLLLVGSLPAESTEAAFRAGRRAVRRHGVRAARRRDRAARRVGGL